MPDATARRVTAPGPRTDPGRVTTERLVRVALPVPVFRDYTYAVPSGLRHDVARGSRVVVPVRGRRVIGYCLGEADAASLQGRAARPLLDVPDAAPALGPALLELARWISEYYVTPLGMVLRTTLPAALGRVGRPDAPTKTRRVLAVARELPTLVERARVFQRAPQQRAAYELLESMGGRAPMDQVRATVRCTDGVLRALVQRGLARVESEAAMRDPFATRLAAPAPRHAPTPAQQGAVDALVRAAPGSVTLLHGVTGSGKTLVYLELLEEVVVRRGRSAIVLVPEIALTPQTTDRFRARFGDQVAVLHSGLSDGERYDAWRELREGRRRIAVGARSAVFAPLEDLGAVIVDEEHEGSYKQGEAPRYHAREVAIMRARGEGALCVLGSATPALESWVNAQQGKHTLLTLPDRVGGATLPRVAVVDLRERRVPAPQPPETRSLRQVLSPALEQAIARRLDSREQVILLLNRRGYARFVQCRAAGHVPTCPNCSITLTLHRQPERLVCHYCQHQQPVPTACAECGGDTMRQTGLGTQQVERVVQERFPGARVARMDVDTTAGKWAHAAILDRVGRAEVDILLGTQMIAKGLDFPGVTLVGVIDADVGLNLPDFRASERTFQLLAQVAGRAGRGARGGEVLIQTRAPEHHAIQCALTHDYVGFATEELSRRRTPAYPPQVRLARVLLSGTDDTVVGDAAIAAADWLASADAAQGGGVQVVGPAKCAVERIQQRWRWHLLLKSDRASALGRLARAFLMRFPVPAQGDLRVGVDRDPVSLL